MLDAGHMKKNYDISFTISSIECVECVFFLLLHVPTNVNTGSFNFDTLPSKFSYYVTVKNLANFTEVLNTQTIED